MLSHNRIMMQKKFLSGMFLTPLYILPENLQTPLYFKIAYFDYFLR